MTVAEAQTQLQLTIARDDLIKPLQLIASAIDKKQTLPILSNILFSVDGNQATLTGTDLEIELIQKVNLSIPVNQPVNLIIPAKKLHDICKALPSGAELSIKQKGNQLKIQSGRSRFSLSLLPPENFPTVEKTDNPLFSFDVEKKVLSRLFEKTHFAMAQQDVRYFLNGLLIELSGSQCSAAATDGHRLAIGSQEIELSQENKQSVLIPRKAILELIKLLHTEDGTETVTVEVGENYVSVVSAEFICTSKLIDGRFPEYRNLLPKQSEKIATIERQALKDALSRVAILSNEKYRGAWLEFKSDMLILQANNPDKDEAEEEVMIEMQGDSIRVGCNVNYILDALNVIETDYIQFMMNDANSSMLIQGVGIDSEQYVIMPMCL